MYTNEHALSKLAAFECVLFGTCWVELENSEIGRKVSKSNKLKNKHEKRTQEGK